MRLLVFIVLLQMYECQNHNKTHSVNLNLKTIFELENHDNFLDVQLINKVQGFLDRLKGVLHPTKTIRRSGAGRTNAYTNLTFTDFISSAVSILQTYKDEDLEEVITVFDDEIRKYHYRGCRFYELVENYDMRRVIADKLDQLKTKRAEDIKEKLDEVLHNLKSKDKDLMIKMMIAFSNSLYNKKDSVKFNEFLDNLALYKRKSKRRNLNLVNIIRTGLRSIVFDHYTNLNHETRNNLKMKLETFWKVFNSPTTHSNVWQTESVPTAKSKDNAKKKKIDESISSCSYEKHDKSTTRKSTQHKKRKSKKNEHNIEKQHVTEKRKITERATEKRKVTERGTEKREFTERVTEKREITDRAIEKRRITERATKKRKITERTTEKRKIAERTTENIKMTERATEKRKSTEREKLSFLTLYPESITNHGKLKEHKPTTVTQQHRLSTHNVINKHKRHRVHRPKKHDEREHVVVGKPSRTMRVDIKPAHGTRPAKMGKMRFHVVKRASDTDVTTKSYQTTKDRGEAKMYQDAADDRITVTAESSEGMDIQSFESSSNEEAKSYRYRKSNDNDTLEQTTVATTQSTTETTNNTDNFIKRIRDLEKELREVKEKIKHSVKIYSNSSEQPRSEKSEQFSSKKLEFWAGTTKREEESKLIPNKATTRRTSKLITTLKITEETTVKSTTEQTTNTPKGTSNTLFRDRSNKSSEESHKITRKITTKPDSVAMDLVELKQAHDDTNNQLADSKTTLLSRKDNHNSGDTEDETLDIDENENKDVTRDMDINNYVEDTRDGKDPQKSERVQLMMVEDMKKIMPDERKDVTAATELVATIDMDNTDPLDIFNEGGDLMK